MRSLATVYRVNCVWFVFPFAIVRHAFSNLCEWRAGLNQPLSHSQTEQGWKMLTMDQDSMAIVVISIRWLFENGIARNDTRKSRRKKRKLRRALS